MKKKNFKSLKLNKRAISTFNELNVKGGATDQNRLCGSIECTITCSEYPCCLHTLDYGQMGPCQNQ